MMDGRLIQAMRVLEARRLRHYMPRRAYSYADRAPSERRALPAIDGMFRAMPFSTVLI